MSQAFRFESQSRLIGVVAALALTALAVTILVYNALAPDAVARGRWTAEVRCGGCHDVAATTPADRRSDVPSMMWVARKYTDSAAVLAFLERPHPMMPPHPMSQEEKAQLAAYIASLAPR